MTLWLDDKTPVDLSVVRQVEDVSDEVMAVVFDRAGKHHKHS